MVAGVAAAIKKRKLDCLLDGPRSVSAARPRPVREGSANGPAYTLGACTRKLSQLVSWPLAQRRPSDAVEWRSSGAARPRPLRDPGTRAQLVSWRLARRLETPPRVPVVSRTDCSLAYCLGCGQEPYSRRVFYRSMNYLEKELELEKCLEWGQSRSEGE